MWSFLSRKNINPIGRNWLFGDWDPKCINPSTWKLDHPNFPWELVAKFDLFLSESDWGSPHQAAAVNPRYPKPLNVWLEDFPSRITPYSLFPFCFMNTYVYCTVGAGCRLLIHEMPDLVRARPTILFSSRYDLYKLWYCSKFVTKRELRTLSQMPYIQHLYGQNHIMKYANGVFNIGVCHQKRRNTFHANTPTHTHCKIVCTRTHTHTYCMFLVGWYDQLVEHTRDIQDCTVQQILETLWTQTQRHSSELKNIFQSHISPSHPSMLHEKSSSQTSTTQIWRCHLHDPASSTTCPNLYSNYITSTLLN